MKKVLIALDYDLTAEKVADIGYTLAKAMNAIVILLHVTAEASYYASLDYSPVMGFAGFSSFNNENVAEVMNNLKKESGHFLQKVKAHLGDNAIITLVSDGDTADTILFTAEEQNADMIVLGTHSKGALDTFLMGSVSQKVLKCSKLPLLIVPAKTS